MLTIHFEIDHLFLLERGQIYLFSKIWNMGKDIGFLQMECGQKYWFSKIWSEGKENGFIHYGARATIYKTI